MVKVVYSTTNIKAKSKYDIVNRNSLKRANLNKLIDCKFIWKDIPYKIYYMSSNLDHVLYNEFNLTDDEKENKAHEFHGKYRKNVADFYSFISDSNFSVQGNYLGTWDFIKKDKNSLCRHTNLGLCFIKKDIR